MDASWECGLTEALDPLLTLQVVGRHPFLVGLRPSDSACWLSGAPSDAGGYPTPSLSAHLSL